MSDRRLARSVFGTTAIALSVFLAVAADGDRKLQVFAVACAASAVALLSPSAWRRTIQRLLAAAIFAATILMAITGMRRGDPIQEAITLLLFFGIPALLFALGRIGAPLLLIPKRPRWSVEINERDIRVTLDGTTTTLSWDSIRSVAIVTNDRGPDEDDTVWEIAGWGPTLAFPSRSYDQPLIDALVERLPGFDAEGVFDAMGSTAVARFELWPLHREPDLETPHSRPATGM